MGPHSRRLLLLGTIACFWLAMPAAAAQGSAVKWKKPLSARLQPVAGKKAGERTEFDDPFLTNAVIQPLP